MDAGCEARLFVPRVLAVMGESEGARAEWQAGWEGVPSQALLPWAAQMLSLLDLPEGAALLATLKVRISIFFLANRPTLLFCIRTF